MRHRQQPAPPLKIPCGKSRRPRRDCVPMTVIVASKTSVILLDEKYTPYPRRGVQIENICGMFATYVELGMLRGLIVDTITPFGVQHTLYHVDGTLVVDQGRGFFKGCRYFLVGRAAPPWPLV